MASRALLLAAALAALLSPGRAAKLREGVTQMANPVRKVVSMMQAMEGKVQEEGEKEKELFDKFMCYCKTGVGSLEKSISDAETKIPALKADMEGTGEQVEEMKETLKQEQAERESSKEAMEQATAIREKDAATFASIRDEYNANIGAITKATAAIEQGAGAAFLQSDAAGFLRNFAQTRRDMLEEDRQQVLSFLSGGQDSSYAPASGEITGILKQLGETMQKSLADATVTEESAIKVYDNLMAAKTKEVDALTVSIESKTSKVGELSVAVVEMKSDLDDTSEMLAEDKKFLKELTNSCSTKEAEWEERQKTRVAELKALADTIKLLNDDEALELFKKTLPAPSASFVQVQVSAKAVRRRAQAEVARARRAAAKDGRGRAGIDLIALALSGNKVEFTKVIKLIDDMVKILEEEQVKDEEKKAYCTKEFDAADDKKKATQNTLEDATHSISSCKSGIETLVEEIATLVEGIKDLDKDVADQTVQRKDENAEYKDLMASDSAAKELLDIAKNRLNKFYNPSLASSLQVSGIEFVQVSARARKADPGPPPETFGEYEKKGEQSTGVIAMIDMLIKDLDVEMAEAKVVEKNAQEEYETFVTDSAAKRVADSKGITDKEETKAELESDLEEYKATAVSAFKELEATTRYISSLHAECDFLMNFFDVREKARAGEIDALKSGKAVLSGADYSLLERATRHVLRQAW